MEDGDTERPSDMEVVDDGTLKPQHSTVSDKDKNVNSLPDHLPNNPKSPSTQVQQDHVMVDQADDSKNADSSLSHAPETKIMSENTHHENQLQDAKTLSHQELVTPRPKDKNVREVKNVLNDTEMTDYDESGTCSDREAFMKELETFYRGRSLEFKPPKFYGEPLNCLKLWRAVIRLGGYDVTAQLELILWKSSIFLAGPESSYKLYKEPTHGNRNGMIHESSHTTHNKSAGKRYCMLHELPESCDTSRFLNRCTES